MAQHSLDDSMGVVFIGFTVDAVLHGIVIFQVYRYSQSRGSDSLSLKSLIAILCILDTLQLIFIAHALYHFLISNFANPIALEVSIWSLNLEVATTVIVTFLVRCAFAARLWHMSNRNKILVTAISVLSLGQLGLGIGMCAITFIVMRFDALPRYVAPISVQFGSAALADILTTSGLVYYLIKSKRQTEIRRTRSLINQLIMWSVNTALMTGVFELLGLITWVTMPHNLTFLFFHLVVGKLYTNSLLATLNSREKRRQRDVVADSMAFTSVPPEITELSFRTNVDSDISSSSVPHPSQNTSSISARIHNPKHSLSVSAGLPEEIRRSREGNGPREGTLIYAEKQWPA